jgi:hypothetical protein
MNNVIWNGYILIEKSTGVDSVKSIINNKATGEDQCCVINFVDSINGKKTLVRCGFNIDGQDLIDWLDALDIDSYSIFGDESYSKNELILRMKLSSILAYNYKRNNIDEFVSEEDRNLI